MKIRHAVSSVYHLIIQFNAHNDTVINFVIKLNLYQTCGEIPILKVYE